MVYKGPGSGIEIFAPIPVYSVCIRSIPIEEYLYSLDSLPSLPSSENKEAVNNRDSIKL